VSAYILRCERAKNLPQRHRGTEKSSETEEKNHHRHIAVIDIAAIARLGNS
jgi:hypothetical protein